MITIMIGRNPNCDFRLSDGSVSRLHAVLTVSDIDQLHIVDRQSRNGVYVRDENDWRRVEKARVQAGDRIRLGEAEVIVAEILSAIASSGAARPAISPTPPQANVSRPFVVRGAGSGEAEAPLQKFRKPRRNPVTGEIEEGG